MPQPSYLSSFEASQHELLGQPLGLGFHFRLFKIIQMNNVVVENMTSIGCWSTKKVHSVRGPQHLLERNVAE
jgi:hypothetical protein